VLSGDDEAAKTETRADTGFVLAETVKLLHPIMPFITEELWDKLDQRAGKGELVKQAWTVLPPTIADAAADAEMGWLVRLITDIRSARSEVNVPAGAKLNLLVRDASAETRARLDRHRAAIERLARVESIQLDAPAPKGALQVVIGEATYALPVADVIDLKAERARLEKEIRKLDGEVAKIDAKLGNTQFMSKAPEDVVAEQRERPDDAMATTARLRQAMDRLAG
jgi:valyl-tRNA synthetase